MHAVATTAPSAALRTLLRSFGQIVLQENALTGLCLLAGWLLYEPRLACAALMGAVAANVGAVLAHRPDDELHAGLHGFNGALAGLAAFSFLADDATAYAVAILAATGTAWLSGPWSRWLRARGLGYFSSPCLMVTWLWLPMTPHAPVLTAVEGNISAVHALDAPRFCDAVLAGLAQCGFASGALAGVLVLAGIAASSPQRALCALAGAAIATALHVALGAPASSFDAGLLGFNGALVALALIDCGVTWMLYGVTVSVALQAAASYTGFPAMTAPFVLATWSVQWLRRRVPAGRSHAEPSGRA